MKKLFLALVAGIFLFPTGVMAQEPWPASGMYDEYGNWEGSEAQSLRELVRLKGNIDYAQTDTEYTLLKKLVDWDSAYGRLHETMTDVTANQHHTPPTSLGDFTGGNWKVFYTDGSGVITEVALGADNEFLMSNGAAVAPTFESIGGGGDMLKATYDADSNDMVDATEAGHVFVRKGSAGTITEGTPVYLSGYNVGGWYEVETADADDAAKMPAIGIAGEDITNAASAMVVASGEHHDFDTTGGGESWAVGQALYVSDAGALTDIRPPNTDDAIQKVAQVARAHAVNGSILIFGAGRSNDVPNLEDAKMWIGNASNIATPVALGGDVTIDNAGVVTVIAGDVDTATTAGTATALAGDPTDCAANEFADSIVASGNLGCNAIIDADVPNGITIDLASAATALNADPTDCGANTFATTIAASGNLTCTSVDIGDDTNLTGGRSLTVTADTVAADPELYTDTKCARWNDPEDTDDFQSVWTANGFAVTITKLWCESDQTVNADMQIDDGSPADVAGTDLVCDSTPAEDEAGLTGAMADGDRLDIVITSTSGTPTWWTMCWTFTIND